MNTRSGKTRTIGIYVYDEVEVLDFAGPFEVFSTASRVSRRLRPQQPVPFTVVLVAESAGAVRARGGLSINAAGSFADSPTLDVLIVPGGEVTQELEKPQVSAWIAHAAAATVLTVSVCTGAFLLAKAGLLDDRCATTHWEDLDELERTFPRVRVQRDVPWVDDGNIVTSAGISAGIDMSLYLVSRLDDDELATRTARQMDYTWRRARPRNN